ncbi:MAG: hypothetical protein CMN30_20000 [Sandaracinus sp.]|nr:hypothetical protein [Sandaracinus sp.]|tara:strand:+ start:1473 stop:1697 length:225 start_codon:yes stop_codon:yes gene_type:complete
MSQDNEYGAGPEGRDEGETPVRLGSPRRGRKLKKKRRGPKLTAEQRLLVLDTWKRSGLPARDFAPLVGLSKHTL